MVACLLCQVSRSILGDTLRLVHHACNLLQYHKEPAELLHQPASPLLAWRLTQQQSLGISACQLVPFFRLLWARNCRRFRCGSSTARPSRPPPPPFAALTNAPFSSSPGQPVLGSGICLGLSHARHLLPVKRPEVAAPQ